jgi:hypothetical protein
MNMPKKIKLVTPCCKVSSWHFTNVVNVNDSVVRCDVCNKTCDFNLLERIINGFNPLTYFCDKCHAREEDCCNA